MLTISTYLIRPGVLARVTFTLIALLLVSAREARAQDWADARAHDKGCRGAAHIFHVRCERSDQDWSDRCSDMPNRLFRGSTMTTDPVRLADKAWTEVAVADGVCGPLPTSQGNAGTVDWADARAHDKGCRGHAHLFHVRCERPDQSWSTECADMPKRLFRGIMMAGDPVRLPDKAWTEVIIKDGTCEPLPTDTAKGRCREECDSMLKSAVTDAFGNVGSSGESGSEVGVALVACHAYCEGTRHADLASLNWYEKWAAAKECVGVNRVYHIPCTDGDGVWATARDKDRCPGFPDTIKGKALAEKAEDLSGNLLLVWKSFEIPDDSCKQTDWADARAHDKGCRGAAHIFHVRCEHPDGSWSHECTDMSTRSFRGNAMTTAPVRLPDRAWTEVAIADATCGSDVASGATKGSAQAPVPRRGKEYVLPDGTIERGAVNNPPDTQAPTSPPGGGTASAPNTQLTAQPPDGPSSPPKSSARKYPPRSEAGLAPAQSPPAACDAEKVTLCKTLLQDRVPWKMRSEPEYRRWQEGNMDNLCRCTPDAAQTVQCFQNELYNKRDSWQEAINACRAH